MVDQAAVERGLAADVAGEAIAAAVEARRHLDRRVLGRRDDRPQREEPLQDFAALAVDIAGGGADLGVAIALQRLLDEVDQLAPPAATSPAG